MTREYFRDKPQSPQHAPVSLNRVYVGKLLWRNGPRTYRDPVSGGVIRDVHDRAIEFDTDLTRRWSGVVASSEQLAAELINLVLGD